MSSIPLFILFTASILFTTISCDCSSPNCLTCDAGTPGICTQCRDNFILFNGKCLCRENSCATCDSSYDGACSQCKNGFDLKDSYCNCKLPGCQYCNMNGCDQCYSGFRLENSRCISDSSTVINCYDANCQFCSDSLNGGCYQCNVNYNLHSGQCIQNPSCIKKNLLNQCIQCPDGFYPLGNGCQEKCAGQQCTSLTCENTCLICENYQLYQYSNCSPKDYCSDVNCENCISSQQGDCFRCKLGYRLYQGKCTQCSDSHCIECDYDNSKCSSCQEDYFLVNGECIPMNSLPLPCSISNCAKCITLNYCSQCIDKFSMTNGRCAACDIANCQSCIEDNQCFVCKEGFMVNEGNCIEMICGNHCLSCSNQYQCNKCEMGFKVIGGQCVKESCPLDNCAQCNNNILTCSQCDNHYYLTDSGACQRCSASNCQSCTERECLSCNSGYSLTSDNQCSSSSHIEELVPHCLLYKADGSCQKCERNCVLKSGRRCKCISYIAVIIGLVSALVLMAIIIGCSFIFRKRKISDVALRNAEAAGQNQNQLEHRDENSQKIPDEEMNKIIQNDLLIPKCSLCKTESSTIQLNCGCFLCQEQGKSFLLSFEEDYKEKETKLQCPNCQLELSSAKRVYDQCGICLEVTTKTFNFNCNCAMKVCVKCYNKCIDSKKCPGCRKDLVDPQLPSISVPISDATQVANQSIHLNPQDNEIYTNVNTNNYINNDYFLPPNHQVTVQVNDEIAMQTNALPLQIVQTNISSFHQ